KDIVAIVLEHPRKIRGPLSPKIVEVDGRDHEARNIVVPSESEHVLLERSKPAIGQTSAPEPPGGAQQIEVEPVLRPAPPGQNEARLEQRKIEAGAVVRDETIEVAEQIVERREQRGFLVEIAHEVLAHLEPFAIEEADADEEGICPRAAGETR